MFIASTLKGLENICCEEVSGKKIINCRVQFEKKQEVRSALVVYELLADFEFKNLAVILARVKKLKIPIKGSFKVECNREGKHKFSSQAVKEEIGGWLYGQGHKVDLKHPETIVYLDIVDKHCFLGLNPEHCGKRKYRIRGSRQALNATIAYGLLKIAEFKPDDVLVDVFCGDGVILIEAGLLGGKKLYGLAEYLQNAKINSHLAGVKIHLHKEKPEYLSSLFQEKEIACIITQPPFYDAAGINEMFSQARNLLKENGKMIIISDKMGIVEKTAEKQGWKGKKKLEIVNGDICYLVKRFNAGAA